MIGIQRTTEPKVLIKHKARWKMKYLMAAAVYNADKPARIARKTAMPLL